MKIRIPLGPRTLPRRNARAAPIPTLLFCLVVAAGAVGCTLLLPSKGPSSPALAVDLRGALPPATASDGALVGTEAEDARTARKVRGPSWRTYVLPIRDSVVGEAPLLLGYLREFGDDFASTPEPGACIVTQGVAVESTRPRPGERMRTRRLHMGPLDALTREIVADLLYAAFDEESGGLVALGRFDAEGTSRCALPEKGLAISTGFGLSRAEIRVPAGAKEIEVPPVKRGRLRVDPRSTAGSGSLEGAILRLGREAPQPLEALGRDALDALRLPLSIVGDLFRTVPNPSENLQAREILQTSLLMGDTPFSLALEPGTYVAIVVRPDAGVRCVERIVVEKGASKPLRCEAGRDASVGDAKGTRGLRVEPADGPGRVGAVGNASGLGNAGGMGYADGGGAAGGLGGTARLDASFLPLRLLRSAQMRQWMAAAGLTHALVASDPAGLVGRTGREGSGAGGTDANGAGEGNGGKPGAAADRTRDFTLAALPESPTGLPDVGPFSGWFALLEGGAAEARAQQVRVATAADLLEVERRVASYLRRGDPTLLPLGGTGEPEASDRVTPFLLTTRYRVSKGTGFRPDDAEILVSNGVGVEWLEPNPLEGTFPLRLPLQQRFRARIHIPRGHRPDYAELWVDGALHRRWVTQRVDPSSEESFLIDERIEKTQDFTVAVSVWGQAFLPEVIYGSSTAPTVAFTRAYCIDANENGICEAAR